VRAAAWSMAIAIMSGVIALNYVHARVLLVSLGAGSFVGTYLSVVSENGKAIRHNSGSSRNRLTVRFTEIKAVKAEKRKCGPAEADGQQRVDRRTFSIRISIPRRLREGPPDTGHSRVNNRSGKTTRSLGFRGLPRYERLCARSHVAQRLPRRMTLRARRVLQLRLDDINAFSVSDSDPGADAVGPLICAV